MLDELKPRADELHAHYETFTAFLSRLNDAQWNQAVGAEQYTARQTVAHFAGAAKSMTLMGKSWVAGKENTLRPDFDLAYFNARQQEKRAQMTNAELLAEWQDAQRGVIAFMETLTSDDLEKRGEHPSVGNVSLRELLRVITTHEADHMAQVMNALAVA